MTAYFRNIFILFMICTAASASSLNLEYSVQYNNLGMPNCLSDKHNPKNGIVIFYDKNLKIIPRKIFYSKIDQLISNNIDHKNPTSISSCEKLKYINTQTLIGAEINLDEQEIVLGEFHLTENLIGRLKQMRDGSNKYFPYQELNSKDYQFFRNGLFEKFNLNTHKYLLKNYGEVITDKIYSDYISTKHYDDCESLIGSCEYYLCRESKKSCGAKGYFIGFGFQYCSESLGKLMQNASPIGKQWLKVTATCLHKKINEVSDQNNCNTIKQKAIESHSGCYSEIDFCSLDLKDVLHIFKLIYPEMTDPDVLKQGIAVLKSCKKE